MLTGESQAVEQGRTLRFELFLGPKVHVFKSSVSSALVGVVHQGVAKTLPSNFFFLM